MDFLKVTFTPVFVIVFGLSGALLLLNIRGKEPYGKKVLVGMVVMLWLLSFRPFSNGLLWTLERKYPPLDSCNVPEELGHVVVLTAWDSDDRTLPYTSNIGYRSALRALEAHRIYQAHFHKDTAKILVSGSAAGTRLMSKVIRLLGVPEENVLEDVSENTSKSAASLKKRIGDQPFILVTSALHLPRAMKSFVHEGLRPIPAPADFNYGYREYIELPLGKPFTYYMPSMDALERSDRAIYEYIGLLWYYITGKTS